MELLIQYADIGKEEIVGEIITIIGPRRETILLHVAMCWPCLGTTNTSRKG